MTRPRIPLPALVLLALGALVLAVGVALTAGSQAPPPRAGDGLRGSQLPPGLTRTPTPPIRLLDARSGRMLDTSTLRGRPYALTFLYTRCPDVCPLIGQELRQALQDLGPRARRVAVIAVSVDPRGDTLPAVRTWLRRQRQPANFHYLIGTRRQLAPVWKQFFVAPQVSDRPETSTHTASVWLADAHSRLRTTYPAGSAFDPADVAHDLGQLLDEAQP